NPGSVGEYMQCVVVELQCLQQCRQGNQVRAGGGACDRGHPDPHALAPAVQLPALAVLAAGFHGKRSMRSGQVAGECQQSMSAKADFVVATKETHFAALRVVNLVVEAVFVSGGTDVVTHGVSVPQVSSSTQGHRIAGECRSWKYL